MRSDPTTDLRQRQPAVGLRLRNLSLMDYYSFNRPRRDGWLSWPCWLTDSGRFTHKVVTRPAISLAQVRESSPARTGGLTTILRHQLVPLSVHPIHPSVPHWHSAAGPSDAVLRVPGRRGREDGTSWAWSAPNKAAAAAASRRRRS